MNNTPRVLLVFFITFLLIFIKISPSFAVSNPLIMTTEDERMVQWDLSADEITSHNDSDILEAKGNVYLRHGNEYMKADFARYYTGTKWVYLSGNIHVRMGKDELQAKEAEFDLRSRVGWLKQGRIFIEGPHAYISGEKINKHFGDVYTFKQAKITTCDGDVPAWSIATDEAILEVNGYARMRNTSFQINDTPVAVTPFFLFPTKTSRQTGFLIPDFGRSSKKGIFYNQPFFWAINDSSDLTFNEEFMEKHGFMHGLQYRTRPYSDTTGWIRFDWMLDKKRGKNTSEGPFQAEGLERTNDDRFWLRGMLDTRLPDPSWRFKADLDYVSDQNYLSDFKQGYSGFQQSQTELFELFRRDLKEKDQNRVSGMLLTRDWERASIALSASYTQNPQLGHGNTPRSSDSTVQKIPQFDAFVYKGRIFPSLPLEAEASAQAGFFHRRNGTRGARYTVSPRVSLPINTRYGSIIGTAGLTQVYYNTDRPSKTNPDIRRGPKEIDETKTVMDYSIAASTDFAKVYNFNSAPLALSNGTVGTSRWAALKHSIQPRIEFRNRPYEDQVRNPYYDEEDRLLPSTDLVYSITNVLTRKKESVVLNKNNKAKMEPTLVTSYVDLMRLRVEQSYDFREATRSDQRNTYARRPYGDIFSDLTVSVSEYMDISTRNNWSPYYKKMTRHQSGVLFKFPEVGKFYMGYDLRSKLNEYKRHRDEQIKYLAMDGELDVFGPISLTADYRYDFENSNNKKYGMGVTYKYQCFSLTGGFDIEPNDKVYRLMFTLTGLGD